MKLTYVNGLTVLGVVVQSLLLCLVMTGCFEEVRFEDLPGTYVADHDKGTDILELKADGTLIHLVETLDGKKYCDTSTWEFEVDSSGTFTQYRLRLKGYYQRIPEWLLWGFDSTGKSLEWKKSYGLDRVNWPINRGCFVSKSWDGVYIDRGGDLGGGWLKQAP